MLILIPVNSVDCYLLSNTNIPTATYFLCPKPFESFKYTTLLIFELTGNTYSQYTPPPLIVPFHMRSIPFFWAFMVFWSAYNLCVGGQSGIFCLNIIYIVLIKGPLWKIGYGLARIINILY